MMVLSDCGKELSQSVLEEIVDCVSPLPIKPKATEAEKDEKAKGPVETGRVPLAPMEGVFWRILWLHSSLNLPGMCIDLS